MTSLTTARAVLITLATALAVTPALALDVAVTKDTTASADAAWKAVGDFCGIGTWHPALAKCELSTKDGATFRALTLKGGGVILEKQLAFDAAGRSYSYSIEGGPLPVQNYTAKLSLVPKGNGATFSWTAKFDAKGAPDADAVKTITGVFEGGLAALAK